MILFIFIMILNVFANDPYSVSMTCSEKIGATFYIKLKRSCEYQAGNRINNEYKKNPKLNFNSEEITLKLFKTEDCEKNELISSLKKEFNFYLKTCNAESAKNLHDAQTFREIFENETHSPSNICEKEIEAKLEGLNNASLELFKQFKDSSSEKKICENFVKNYNTLQKIGLIIDSCYKKNTEQTFR